MRDDPPGESLAIELVPEGELPVAPFAEVHLLGTAAIATDPCLNDGSIVAAVRAPHIDPNRDS